MRTTSTVVLLCIGTFFLVCLFFWGGGGLFSILYVFSFTFIAFFVSFFFLFLLLLFWFVSLVGWIQFCVLVFLCRLDLRPPLHPPASVTRSSLALRRKNQQPLLHEVTSSAAPHDWLYCAQDTHHIACSVLTFHRHHSHLVPSCEHESTR